MFTANKPPRATWTCLVEFEEPIGLFEFMDLEFFLSDTLGIKVDLVSKKALKPHIGKRIHEEVIIV